MLTSHSFGVLAGALILPLVRGDSINVNVDLNVAITTIEPFPSCTPTPITCQGQEYVTYQQQSVCNPYQTNDCMTGYKPVTTQYCSTTVSGYNGPYVVSDCYQPYTYSREITTSTTSLIVETPGYYVAYDTTTYCPQPTTLVYAVPSAAYYVQPYIQYYQAPSQQVVEVEQCVYISSEYRVCEIYVNYLTVSTYQVPEYSLVPYTAEYYCPEPTILNLGINIHITIDSAPTTYTYSGTKTKTVYKTSTKTKTRTATSSKTVSQTIHRTATVTAQPTAVAQQFLLTVNIAGTKKRATSGFLHLNSAGNLVVSSVCAPSKASIFNFQSGRLLTDAMSAAINNNAIALGVAQLGFIGSTTSTDFVTTTFGNANGGLTWKNSAFPEGTANFCLYKSSVYAYFSEADRANDLPDCTPFTAGIQTDISCAVSGSTTSSSLTPIPTTMPNNGTSNSTSARLARRAAYVYLH